jgi:uncharacterized delta-60 repeat protein
VYFAHVEVVGGKLLIAGTHEYGTYQYDSYVARLGLDGVPDPTFGTGGVVRYHSGDDGYPGLVRFVADPASGRYLTVDTAEDANYVDHAYVRRYTLHGQLDTAWATDGMATITTADTINDLDVLPDGRIRLTGSRTVSTSSTATNKEDMVFIGLTADGALDLDFGVDGFQTINLTKYDGASALLPVGGGKYVVAGAYNPDGSSSDFLAVRLTTGADVAPPKVASTTPDFATRRAIVVGFNESVLATLAKTDLTVQRYQGFNQVVVNRADYTFEAVDVDGKTRLTITLAATVPDGDFDVYIPAGAVADPQGNATTVGLWSSKVFFLAGDANRDRVVNFDDLLALAKNYNSTGATYGGGDFNYDGTVNFDDLLILAKNYNKALPAAGPAVEASPADAAVWAAALGFAVPQPPKTPPAKPPTPALKPTPVAKPQPKPLPKPLPVPPKAQGSAVKKAAEPVFSNTRVAAIKPAPVGPKPAATPARR